VPLERPLLTLRILTGLLCPLLKKEENNNDSIKSIRFRHLQIKLAGNAFSGIAWGKPVSGIMYSQVIVVNQRGLARIQKKELLEINPTGATGLRLLRENK